MTHANTQLAVVISLQVSTLFALYIYIYIDVDAIYICSTADASFILSNRPPNPTCFKRELLLKNGAKLKQNTKPNYIHNHTFSFRSFCFKTAKSEVVEYGVEWSQQDVQTREKESLR